jgi:hypothetical protein
VAGAFAAHQSLALDRAPPGDEEPARAAMLGMMLFRARLPARRQQEPHAHRPTAARHPTPLLKDALATLLADFFLVFFF